MTPGACQALRRCLWIFVGSFFLTPLLLWFFVAVVPGRDYAFRQDYLDFYRDMFSRQPEMIFAWLILLVPVLIYEFAAACWYYCRHPAELRSVFQFPRKDKR
jgi:hypothetical protein